MRLFSVLFIGFCISFADSLFPYTAIALGAWVIGAVTVANWEKIFSN